MQRSSSRLRFAQDHREKVKERFEGTNASLGAPWPSPLQPRLQRPALPPPGPRAPLTGRRKGRPGAGGQRPMGCAERHFPAAGGERRVSGAVGGRRGRGGRRRRWQRAGTHAAPQPTWPAALPPPAAAARCPLTSGGECGDCGHGVGHAGDSCCPARKSKPPAPSPVHASCRPAGTRGGPLAAHKASRNL